MAYLNYGQKKLSDKLVVTKWFSKIKDGSVEFTFDWTNKNGRVFSEKLLLAVDRNNFLTQQFNVQEYIEHKQYCCIRLADNFIVQEIDS